MCIHGCLFRTGCWMGVGGGLCPGRGVSSSIHVPIAGSQPETHSASLEYEEPPRTFLLLPGELWGVCLPRLLCWSLSEKAKRQCSRISGSARCVPPLYAHGASCPSLREYTVCPPPRSTRCTWLPKSLRVQRVSYRHTRSCCVRVPADPRWLCVTSQPRMALALDTQHSLLVRCTRSPSPVADSAVISILSLVLPSLPGTENARNPAGAVGKSRSGGAAQVGLRLPRPCRQGPPACPPPNTPAPGRSGTAASATLPGPAQLSLAAADADGS